jgi:hypothetical protein
MHHQVNLPMNEQPGLLPDGFYHFGMAVTRVGHANPAGEIQHLAPIRGVQVTAFGVVNNDVSKMRPNG